jgi:HAD superfamily hydrolase (TIGR01549 family)
MSLPCLTVGGLLACPVMLRAALFDIDGTLVDTERESAAAIRRVLARRGVEMSPAELDWVIGHSWHEIYERLRAGHGAALPGMRELIDLSSAEREVVLNEQGLREVRGARDLVRRLAARCPIAAVSGASRREAAFALRGLGVLDAFRFVLTSEDYAEGKPSPDGYLLAAARLGVEPEECLVVEDSAAGIAAGVAAGARVVAVSAANFAGQDQSAAHAVVASPAEIDDALIARLFCTPVPGR